MSGTGVLEIVAVHLRVHRDSTGIQVLMILRARKRREAEEFEDIDRQLLFDDLDIARDRHWCVGREAEVTV
jgi:hypothetical protein